MMKAAAVAVGGGGSGDDGTSHCMVNKHSTW